VALAPGCHPSTIAAVLRTTKDAPASAAEPSGTEGGAAERRGIQTRGRSLREFAGRGVIINALFDVSLSALSLVQGFVLAALLTRSDYGVWGVLVVSLGVLAQLKVIGISDKYLQQDEPDQQLAFQRAFTLELMVTAVALIPLAAALPIIALVYGHWELVLPGAVLLSVLVADALQAPLWIYYRSMNFARQRSLAAIEPVVGFVVTIILAVAGLGYWSLVIGVVAGSWAGAIVALRACPFPLRPRYDRGSLRVYARFSGPIFVATLCAVLLANGTMIASNAHLGLAGAGAVALSAKITEFTTRVDNLISGTLYPAICAVQDRLDLLREMFIKSNRLALMWAVPLGVALVLFAGDLVHFVIGEKWRGAVGLLQSMGIAATINQLGFNWDSYFRARSTTRPIAVTAVVSTVTILGVGIPLLFIDGLTGLGIGICVGSAVQLLFRAWYLSRLFEGFAFAAHAARALLPTLPGLAVVLLLRGLMSGSDSGGAVILELASYGVVTMAATWLLEGPLIREALGYLSPRAS
jgi:O-antigen/teichoic acid export membrane protein